MNNLRQLHIIRGLAALYVAIGHSKVVFWAGGQEYIKTFPIEKWGLLDYLVFAIDMLSSSAEEFVIVFFILSGFFIAFSFERNNWSFKDFLINRVVRIYPPYLFSVLLAILVFLFIDYYNPSLLNFGSTKPIVLRMSRSFHELNLSGFIKSLFYLPQQDYIAGNLSYWSLLPEWIFYLVIPFLIGTKRWPLLIFSIAYLANSLVHFGFENPLLEFVFEYGFYFFLGIETYRFISKNNWQIKMPSKIVSYTILIFVLFATIALGIACEHGLVKFEAASLLSACLLSVVSILTLLKYPNKGAFYKMGVFFGDISYSLYVCHLPIYYFLYALLTKSTGTYFFYDRIYWLFIPLAIGFSYLAYLLVEKRTLVIIKKLKSR